MGGSFWVRASMVGGDGTCPLLVTPSYLSRTMMEAVCTSETSVYFNEIVWLYIPEDCHLHTWHSVQTLSFALKILSNVGVLKLTLECTG
jgi:hypothetical protein